LISNLNFTKMRKIIQAACLLTILPLFGSAGVKNHSGLQSQQTACVNQKFLLNPHATFSKQWIDYDVTEDGSKGMRIHVKFSVYEMKDMESYLAVYYADGKGERLKDKNQKFNSASGEVAVYKKLNPCCNETDYDDLQLFMPYDELDLDAGKYDLT